MVERQPAAAMITSDPRISGGRPVVANTGVPTSIIAERFEAGESIADLVYDYGLYAEQVETALRHELGRARNKWQHTREKR